MNTVEKIQQIYSEVAENPILLEKSITQSVVEGLAISQASFLVLYLQYQKHHFVVEGSDFYMLHNYFEESYEAVEKHAHDLGERLHGLGGVPALSLTKLSELCCFEQEPDDVYRCRLMIEHNLEAERSIIEVMQRQASQAESFGDRATRYLYEQILLKTEERAYHLEHFLTPDTLKVEW